MDKYEGGILTYQGHDILKLRNIDPKKVNQPHRNKDGLLTSNGKFYEAAMQYKKG